jgi:hypothetical protein
MVRRLSVASLDSGAELTVYGEEPSASTDRVSPTAKSPSVSGGRRAVPNGVGNPTEPGAPRTASGGELVVSSRDQAALGRYLAPRAPTTGLCGAVSFGGITSRQVPQCGATRDITMTVNQVPPVQVGTGVVRLATSYDISVVDQQSGKWYVKDIRASTQPMGSPMTRFASSWAVPRGSRSLGKLTDVHGREG